MHLLTEISSFVLESDPQRMVISLHQEPDGIHLCVIDSTPREETALKSIRRALNPGERPELAEYYGHMAGADLVGSARLDLVGWQVKRADVEATDSGTKIELWLGNDAFVPKAPARKV
jgi:hypothetical protein